MKITNIAYVMIATETGLVLPDYGWTEASGVKQYEFKEVEYKIKPEDIGTEEEVELIQDSLSRNYEFYEEYLDEAYDEAYIGYVSKLKILSKEQYDRLRSLQEEFENEVKKVW